MDSVTIARDLGLRGDADFVAKEAVTLSDEALAAHDVDPGDDLGHGVLNLDARVHFDEEPLVRVKIEEKLNRAGAIVTN